VWGEGNWLGMSGAQGVWGLLPRRAVALDNQICYACRFQASSARLLDVGKRERVPSPMNSAKPAAEIQPRPCEAPRAPDTAQYEFTRP
jgi:hypothetical protein